MENWKKTVTLRYSQDILRKATLVQNLTDLYLRKARNTDISS